MAVITLLSGSVATGEVESTVEVEVSPVPEPSHRLARRAALPPPPPQPTVSGPVSYETWVAVARCESGYGGEPNWDLNTGNSFFGGLQFSLSSWGWVGGVGYPHQASKDEQIHRANLLFQRQGWSAWPACSRKLGLRR